MPGEIPGRANHSHPHVRPNPYRNHVLGNVFPQPHAGVETLFDDIDHPVVGVDFHFDVGIVRQQLRQLRQQDGIGRMLGSRKPDIRRRFVAQFAQRCKVRFDAFELGRDCRKQAFARIGLNRSLAAIRIRGARLPDAVQVFSGVEAPAKS